MKLVDFSLSHFDISVYLSIALSSLVLHLIHLIDYSPLYFLFALKTQYCGEKHTSPYKRPLLISAVLCFLERNE